MSVSRIAFIGAGAGAFMALAGGAGDAAEAGATVLALYKKPADPKVFDEYYTTHHAPLAKTLPGLLSYTLSKGLDEKAPYYLVAILSFASADALIAALASPQGQAVVGDLKNFAQAGVDVLTFANVPA